jgi:hypothetical protein
MADPFSCKMFKAALGIPEAPEVAAVIVFLAGT